MKLRWFRDDMCACAILYVLNKNIKTLTDNILFEITFYSFLKESIKAKTHYICRHLGLLYFTVWMNVVAVHCLPEGFKRHLIYLNMSNMILPSSRFTLWVGLTLREMHAIWNLHDNFRAYQQKKEQWTISIIMLPVTKGAQFDQFDWPRTLRTYNIDFSAQYY